MTSKNADGSKTSGETAKELLKKYGSAYLITSISFAIVSFAICYLLVDFGKLRISMSSSSARHLRSRRFGLARQSGYQGLGHRRESWYVRLHRSLIVIKGSSVSFRDNSDRLRCSQSGFAYSVPSHGRPHTSRGQLDRAKTGGCFNKRMNKGDRVDFLTRRNKRLSCVLNMDSIFRSRQHRSINCILHPSHQRHPC